MSKKAQSVPRSTLANTLRILSIDAIEAAQSGHPGMPMGMADIAEVLWNDFLQHDPAHPHWINRDRFVLSNGHGSMLLYALLHLTGYPLALADLKNFRQLGAKTHGHPEVEIPGVETTTGPLGQGLANAVGMALAEKKLAAAFNRPSLSIIDHYTYAFVGDGCLMEGISHEVCSLAGTLGLHKLIVFYDDNGISIDGAVQDWFSDDTVARFRAYGWQVITKVDGHNPQEIHQAIVAAQANREQPSLICCQTVIGLGSPNKQRTASVHGAPLGAEEVARVRKALDWQYPPFVLPEHVTSSWNAVQAGKARVQKWQEMYQQYQQAYPELVTELERRMQGKLPDDFMQNTQAFITERQQHGSDMASRKASQQFLQQFAPQLPELMGGSADLTESNLTEWQEAKAFTADDATGNYLHYGVREFGMSALMNGMALHGGLLPFGGTFLVFMDYAKNAVRMAALMRQRVIFVYSHDSIGLGEDGPTHQPVEQLGSLRLLPNLYTWRPCDDVETAVAWQQAISTAHAPTALVLSRQTLPHQTRTAAQLTRIQKGGYVLFEPKNTVQAMIIATGSEVSIALAVAQNMQRQHIGVRVVAMPCTELFDQQDADYQQQVLPSTITRRIAIEAASTDCWYKYVGLQGKVIGMSGFGASAPGKVLFQHYRITEEYLYAQLQQMISSADPTV